jgi:hypothetical protein
VINRRGDSTVGKVITAVIVLGGLLVAATIYPIYLAKWEMKEIIQVVLLEWRDKNKTRAQSRLVSEIRKREVPTYIYPEDCDFYTRGKERHLDCWWEVEIDYPGYKKTLEFTVHRYLDASERNVWDFEE